MRFRTQARAELAIRILLLGGLATMITGVVTAKEHGAVGGVLVAVGFVVALLPLWCVSGPETARGWFDDRTPKSGTGYERGATGGPRGGLDFALRRSRGAPRSPDGNRSRAAGSLPRERPLALGTRPVLGVMRGG